MKELISSSAKSSMSSREIAEMYGKPHKNVLAKIRKLESVYTQVFGDGLKFQPVEYKDAKGELRPEILLNKSQALFVASRFDAVLHAKVQKRWEELEVQQQDPMQVLNDPTAMRGLLLTYSEKVLALEAETQAQKPKVEAYERLTLSEGAHNITNTANQLDIQPKKLFLLLSENKWIYRRVGGKGWVGYQDKIQRGLLTHKVTTKEFGDGTVRMFEQVLVTPKGATVIAKKLLVNAS